MQAQVGSQAASESSSVGGWAPSAKVVMGSCMALCDCSLNPQKLRQEDLELGNSLGCGVRPFVSENKRKTREGIHAGSFQSPTTKGSLSSQACSKALRRATEIPHF